MKRRFLLIVLLSAFYIFSNYVEYHFGLSDGYNAGYGKALDSAIVIMDKTNKSDSTVTRLIIKAPKDTVTYILTPKRWYK